MDFNNLKALEKYLSGKIQKSMQDVGRMGEQLVKDTMDEVVYSHEPEEYERTYELRESITWTIYDIGNEITVEVYSDSDVINPYSGSSDHPFAHYSYFWNEQYDRDYSEMVAKTVEYGWSGTKPFGSGYWTEPRPFMGRSREAMQNYHLASKTLKYGLQRNGLKVE